MDPALLIRLRPRGPWRYGPADGALDRVDTLFRSDRLFSAVTLAMRQLGYLDEWLAAMVRAGSPALTFSSLFPFQGDTLFAAPPAVLWPPPSSLVRAPNPVFLAKIRWSVARFVPLPVIDSLIAGTRLLAEQWFPDPESGCLLRRDRPSTSPFRVTLRRSAAVDRLTGVSTHAAGIACTEFEPESGLWALARFQSAQAREEWGGRIESAFRLLSDNGFGGRRSSGWGQTHAPQFQPAEWPMTLLPKSGRTGRNGASPGAATDSGSAARFWLLSLYSPAASDRINWSGGEYRLTTRSGRIENGAGSGRAKQVLQMISEGSVLEATALPVGAAVDVAPEGFEHPVYRSGLALAFELPATAGETPEDLQMDLRPAEEPAVEEAIIERPCEEPAEPAAAPDPDSETQQEQETQPEAETQPGAEAATPASEPEPEPEPAAEAAPAENASESAAAPEPPGAATSEDSTAAAPQGAPPVEPGLAPEQKHEPSPGDDEIPPAENQESDHAL